MKTKIHIGSDHRGYDLKQELIQSYLVTHKFPYHDHGTFSADSCDYPEIAYEVATNIANSEDKGVLICGSGNGMLISANKIKAIRAIPYIDLPRVIQSRQHNDSNIITFGSDYISLDEAIQALNTWLFTPFSKEERHARRNNKSDFL
jgi:ribose 5-phosphate isomerase B